MATTQRTKKVATATAKKPAGTKAVTAKKAGKSVGKPRASKARDPRQVRDTVVGDVLSEARKMVKSVIEEAKKGNYMPVKYLFEFAGIAEPFPEADDEAAARRRSLAEILLQAVQGNAVTKITEREPEQPSVG